MNSNDPVTTYLDFYLDTRPSLSYAVLLDGEWGSGKTFFVQKYRDERKTRSQDKSDFVYISLYGVSKASEIDEQIFQQLHPFLASKPVALFGKALKGALKGTLKIDLDGAGGDSEFSTDFGIEKMSGKDLFGKSKDAIFIFDDLERCLMPIDRILGYINFFVEHQGHRAIILANEDEIAKRKGIKDTKYHEIKEKLIGRTFKISAMTDAAIHSFIETVPSEPAKAVLRLNSNSIRRIYEETNYNNLRSLKQAIHEFASLYALLPDKAKAKSDLLAHVIQGLVVLTLEIRKGALKVEKIKGISSHSYATALTRKKDDKTKDPIREIEEKYSGFSFRQLCPTDECWHTFFKSGSIPSDLLNQAIENSVYFLTETQAEWVRLWHYPELEEAEFAPLVEKVERKFDALEYRTPGVIRHIAGLFIRFSKEKLVERSLRDTMTWLKATIRKLHDQKLLEVEETDSFRFNDAYAGLGFAAVGEAEFKAISKVISDYQHKMEVSEYPKVAAELLVLVETNPRLFWERMSHRFPSGHRYYQVPILSYIEVSSFADAFLKAENQEKKNIAFGLKDRYSLASVHKELSLELPWLRSLKRELAKPNRQLGPLSRYQVSRLVSGAIDPGISSLESQQPHGKSTKKK